MNAGIVTEKPMSMGRKLRNLMQEHKFLYTPGITTPLHAMIVVVWAEFPTADIEYPKRFAVEIHREFPGLPLYFNYSSNLKWHESRLTFDDIAALGYQLMHVSLAGMRATMVAVWDYAADLKARGAQAEIDFEERLIGHPMGAFHQFAGFPKIKELEAKYLPAEEVKKKYEQSVGL